MESFRTDVLGGATAHMVQNVVILEGCRHFEASHLAGIFTNLTSLSSVTIQHDPDSDNMKATTDAMVVPTAIGKLNTIRYIDLRGLQVARLPSELGMLTDLLGLFIERCPSALRPMTGGTGGAHQPESVLALPSELSSLTNLQTLGLSAVGGSGTAISTLVAKMPKLRQLVLQHNGFESFDLPPPAQLPYLWQVDVMNNSLSALPFASFHKLATTTGSYSTLAELNMMHNRIRTLPEHVASALRGVKLLRYVVCGVWGAVCGVV